MRYHLKRSTVAQFHGLNSWEADINELQMLQIVIAKAYNGWPSHAQILAALQVKFIAPIIGLDGILLKLQLLTIEIDLNCGSEASM